MRGPSPPPLFVCHDFNTVCNSWTSEPFRSAMKATFLIFLTSAPFCMPCTLQRGPSRRGCGRVCLTFGTRSLQTTCCPRSRASRSTRPLSRPSLRPMWRKTYAITASFPPTPPVFLAPILSLLVSAFAHVCHGCIAPSSVPAFSCPIRPFPSTFPLCSMFSCRLPLSFSSGRAWTAFSGEAP